MNSSVKFEQSHIPALDGLRGLSALVVVLVHYGFLTHVALARIAVCVFFCLSGFLITRSLIARKSNGSSYSKFFMERSARIFPIYFVVIFIVWLTGEANNAEALAAITYSYNNNLWPSWSLGVIWSLCVEEHFYIIAPLFIWFLPLRAAACMFVALAAYSMYYVWSLAWQMHVATQWAPLSNSENQWLSHAITQGTVSNAITLAVGVILAMIEPRTTANGLLRTIVLLPAASIVAYLLIRLFFNSDSQCFAPVLLHITHVSTGITCFLIGLYHAHAPGWEPLRALLCDARLAWLAGISYGVYLMHQGISVFLVHMLSGPVSMLGPTGSFGLKCLALITTLAVAHWSYTRFERPVMQYAKALRI